MNLVLHHHPSVNYMWNMISHKWPNFHASKCIIFKKLRLCCKRTWNILQGQHFSWGVIPIYYLKTEDIYVVRFRLVLRCDHLPLRDQKKAKYKGPSVNETYRYTDPLYVSKIPSKSISIFSFIDIVNFLIQYPETQDCKKF